MTNSWLLLRRQAGSAEDEKAAYEFCLTDAKKQRLGFAAAGERGVPDTDGWTEFEFQFFELDGKVERARLVAEDKQEGKKVYLADDGHASRPDESDVNSLIGRAGSS